MQRRWFGPLENPINAVFTPVGKFSLLTNNLRGGADFSVVVVSIVVVSAAGATMAEELARLMTQQIRRVSATVAQIATDTTFRSICSG